MRRLLFTAALLGALAMTAMSLAANRQLANVPETTAQQSSPPLTLVVPDVRREAFVFAKGQLEDAGFAWKVTGGVPGFPANVVVSQKPAAGTKLIDTGAPLITLTLERNKQYGSSGQPQDTSPYAPTANRPAGSS
jgi:beta-lactam-binding protein with PASTA domain